MARCWRALRFLFSNSGQYLTLALSPIRLVSTVECLFGQDTYPMDLLTAVEPSKHLLLPCRKEGKGLIDCKRQLRDGQLAEINLTRPHSETICLP